MEIVSESDTFGGLYLIGSPLVHYPSYQPGNLNPIELHQPKITLKYLCVLGFSDNDKLLQTCQLDLVMT